MIEKSLYSIPADYKSAGTLALLLHKLCGKIFRYAQQLVQISRHNTLLVYAYCREAIRLMLWRICYLW